MTEDSLDEWTPEERAKLAEVGLHRSARSELKNRTMVALRERDLIGAAQPRRSPRRFVFGLAAAAVLIFAAGMLAGYGVGLRRQAMSSPDSLSRAGGGTTREVARLDSPSTQSPVGARYVVWF